MRIIRLIAIVVTLIAALLVFPHWIPLFAGLWLLWCAVCTWQGKLTRFELFATPIWLLIKWPEPTISLGVFVALVCVVACWFPAKGNQRVIASVLIGLSWLGWITQHHLGTMGTHSSQNPHGPVVCVGDSLTDYGYPDELRNLISRPVEDFGFNGFTTDDGMKLVPEIVALKPSKIVIELGGHDYKNGESRSKTAANLSQMIESFRACGADVVLVEIPRGFINDPWYGFERQLARKYELDLVPDSMIRNLIYWGPILPPGNLVSKSQRYSEDGLHPNKLGNRMMAKKIAGYLD